MRLVAIYNVWSDCLDLLEKSITNILPVVDAVYVVWSNVSNRGQLIPFTFKYNHHKVTFFHVEPFNGHPPEQSETIKRNFGLNQAKKADFTHFLMMDSDEFYIQEEVMEERENIGDLNGLVCGLRVYIKEPTLWCEDHTLVPFIQKITPDVSVGNFKSYPFAYDENRHAHIDPTRRPSHKDKVAKSSIYMHHFSYVRRDIDLKINNSTANLMRSRDVIYRDLENARPGYVSELYHRELKVSEDLFKIKGPDPVENPALS